MNADFLLKGLIEASKSPLAFISYTIIVCGWIANLMANSKLKTIAKSLKDLPEKDRIKALQLEYKMIPREGLTSSEFLLLQKRKYFLITYLVTIVGILAFFGLSVYKSLYALRNEVEKNTIELAFNTFINGTTSENDKEWQEAIARYEEVVRNHPNYGSFTTLSSLYERVGEPEKALAMAKEARALQPNNPSVYLKIAWSFSDIEQKDSAQFYYDLALKKYRESKKNDTELYVSILGNNGNLYCDRADEEADSLKKVFYAKTAIEKYFLPAFAMKGQLKKKKFLGLLLANTANAYRAYGEYDKAKSFIDEAIEIKKSVLYDTDEYNSLGMGYITLGEIQFAKGNLDKAQKTFMKTLEMFETNLYPVGKGYSLMMLGDIELKRNNRDSALTYWNKARSIFVKGNLKYYLNLSDIRIGKYDS